MTPGEFTTEYLVGTIIDINFERYGFAPLARGSGIYEYVGIKYCSYDCKQFCEGRIMIKDEKGIIHTECLSFLGSGLQKEIPFGELGIVNTKILDDKLFEI